MSEAKLNFVTWKYRQPLPYLPFTTNQTLINHKRCNNYRY
jgi:hypothetical protein